MPSQTSDNDTLGVLRGAEAIGRFIDLFDDDGEVDTRAAYYLLEQGRLPAGKEGGVWTTTKARLRAHYANLPPVTTTEPTDSTEPTEPTTGTDAETPPPRPPRAARSARPAPARRSARR